MNLLGRLNGTSACFLLAPVGWAQEAAGWQREFLGTYASRPAEPLDGFMLRLGRVLFEHTRRTGHEACGVVAQDGQGRHAVMLFTDGVQRGCSMSRREIPEGFVATEHTIHSHPVAREIRYTAADLAWNRAHGQVTPQRTLLVRPGFSPSDLQAGPGWLVEGTAVFFQRSGRGTGKRVGVISPREHAPTREPLLEARP